MIEPHWRNSWDIAADPMSKNYAAVVNGDASNRKRPTGNALPEPENE
jgi:hypothetical protein